MGPTVVPEDRDDVAHLGVAGIGGVAVVFGVLRNLPVDALQSLAP